MADNNNNNNNNDNNDNNDNDNSQPEEGEVAAEVMIQRLSAQNARLTDFLACRAEIVHPDNPTQPLATTIVHYGGFNPTDALCHFPLQVTGRPCSLQDLPQLELRFAGRRLESFGDAEMTLNSSLGTVEPLGRTDITLFRIRWTVFSMECNTHCTFNKTFSVHGWIDHWTGFQLYQLRVNRRIAYHIRMAAPMARQSLVHFTHLTLPMHDVALLPDPPANGGEAANAAE